MLSFLRSIFVQRGFFLEVIPTRCVVRQTNCAANVRRNVIHFILLFCFCFIIRIIKGNLKIDLINRQWEKMHTFFFLNCKIREMAKVQSTMSKIRTNNNE